MNKNKRYKDRVGDIWEYRHGAWGYRFSDTETWHVYASPTNIEYMEIDFGPFVEIDE